MSFNVLHSRRSRAFFYLIIPSHLLPVHPACYPLLYYSLISNNIPISILTHTYLLPINTLIQQSATKFPNLSSEYPMDAMDRI